MQQISSQKIFKRIGTKYEYCPEDKLGAGVHGSVFKGNRLGLDVHQEVAIKVVPLPKDISDYDLLCLKREVEVNSELKTDHKVEYLDYEQTTNNFYIIMELCNEGTLQSKMSRGIKLEEALGIVKHIASFFVENDKIEHRDLKPANILFKNGILKIADFGLSKKKEDPGVQLQTMVGTPIYMAPEIITGNYDQKCDVWSVGVILFEMIYEFLPWAANSFPHLNKLKKSNPIENILKEYKNKKNLDKDVKDLLVKMLQFSAESRISWKEVLNHPALKIYDAYVEAQKKKSEEKPLEANSQTSSGSLIEENKDNNQPIPELHKEKVEQADSEQKNVNHKENKTEEKINNNNESEGQKKSLFGMCSIF